MNLVLPAGDLDQILQLARGLVSITEYGQLQPALGRVARVVGSDTATLTHLDLDSQREVAIRWPGPENPLRREAMPKVTDQLSVLLARHGAAVQAVTLGRFGGTFTGRQKAILHAAQPFIASAVSQARRASGQGMQIPPSAVRRVAVEGAPGTAARVASASLSRLTLREREVLRLVAEGLTDAQVARRLELAPATISKHLRRIYARVGVPNRAAAVRHLLAEEQLAA